MNHATIPHLLIGRYTYLPTPTVGIKYIVKWVKSDSIWWQPLGLSFCDSDVIEFHLLK